MRTPRNWYTSCKQLLSMCWLLTLVKMDTEMYILAKISVRISVKHITEILHSIQCWKVYSTLFMLYNIKLIFNCVISYTFWKWSPVRLMSSNDNKHHSYIYDITYHFGLWWIMWLSSSDNITEVKLLLFFTIKNLIKDMESHLSLSPSSFVSSFVEN